MLRDLRHGARLLLRAPGFTVVAVCALAIGIGANTAIFSVVYTLLLKPLPYQDPERLVVVWEHNMPRDRKNNVVSPGNFLHWREMQQSFEGLSAVGITFKVTLTGIGEPEELPMQLVSASFFPLLGVQPALGPGVHGRRGSAQQPGRRHQRSPLEAAFRRRPEHPRACRDAQRQQPTPSLG